MERENIFYGGKEKRRRKRRKLFGEQKLMLTLNDDNRVNIVQSASSNVRKWKAEICNFVPPGPPKFHLFPGAPLTSPLVPLCTSLHLHCFSYPVLYIMHMIYVPVLYSYIGFLYLSLFPIFPKVGLVVNCGGESECHRRNSCHDHGKLRATIKINCSYLPPST